MPYFVTITEQGPSWAVGRLMREQQLWNEHRDFVNTAMFAGSVILGGPLGKGPTHRALLIINAASESGVRGWHMEDPWVRAGILRLVSIEPWELLVSNDKLDPVLAEILRDRSPSANPP